MASNQFDDFTSRLAHPLDLGGTSGAGRGGLRRDLRREAAALAPGEARGERHGGSAMTPRESERGESENRPAGG